MRPNNLWNRKEKKESKNVAAASEELLMGVDGFAASSDKTSKHMSKKQKKQAKREAKVKSLNKYILYFAVSTSGLTNLSIIAEIYVSMAIYGKIDSNFCS